MEFRFYSFIRTSLYRKKPAMNPTHIYKVVVNVTHDGSYQHNIFKNRVDSVTKKHYILGKSFWRTKAEHIDRELIGAEPTTSIDLVMASGKGWCLEADIQLTINSIKDELQEGIKQAEADLLTMRRSINHKEPLVTHRDTNEYE